MKKEIEKLEDEIAKLREENERLKHYKDTSVGLWVVDRKPCIKDSYQLTYP